MVSSCSRRALLLSLSPIFPQSGDARKALHCVGGLQRLAASARWSTWGLRSSRASFASSRTALFHFGVECSETGSLENTLETCSRVCVCVCVSVCACVRACVRERERQTDRQTDRQTVRDRQTETKRQRQRQRNRERQAERQKEVG